MATSSPKPVVTVMGATGVQGGAVVRALSASSEFSIRAITRNPSSPAGQKLAVLPNVTVMAANMSDPPSLEAAFKGSMAVYGVTNFYDPQILSNPLEEARQGCAMADVAKEQGVQLFIWSTVPSALLRTGATFNSPRLVENKFTISQYLKYRQVPHVDLYLGFYFDNWINFGAISHAQDGALEVSQPILKSETKLGMVWVERDLGRIVHAMLKEFQSHPENVLDKSVYCVSGQYSTADFVEEIAKQTGRVARMISLPSSGAEDLDRMYHYYNDWGVYRDVEIPHPKTTELGVQLLSLSDFVRGAVLPFIKTFENTESKVRGY